MVRVAMLNYPIY